MLVHFKTFMHIASPSENTYNFYAFLSIIAIVRYSTVNVINIYELVIISKNSETALTIINASLYG